MFGFMRTKTHEAAMAEMDAHNESLEQSWRRLARIAANLTRERDAARAVLSEIAAMETPSCAHIGKRMAALARQVLLSGGPSPSDDTSCITAASAAIDEVNCGQLN